MVELAPLVGREVVGVEVEVEVALLGLASPQLDLGVELGCDRRLEEPIIAGR
jgi:hypothetical protein